MFLAYNQRSVILARDFNIKMNLPQNLDTSSFSNLISEFDLHPFFTDSATHDFGNTLDFAVVSSSLLPYLSSISVDSSHASSNQPLTARSRRFYKNRDHDHFSSPLSQSLTYLQTVSNIKDYVQNFNSILTKTLDHFAPVQSIIPKNNKNPAWLDQEYIKARALHRRYQKQGNKLTYNRKNCVNALLSKKRSCITQPFSTRLMDLINKYFSRLLTSSLIKKRTIPLCLPVKTQLP